MSVVGLVARREITTRIQQRGYRISLLVALAVVAVVAVLPGLFGGGDGAPRYDVALTGPADPQFTDTLSAVARSEGAHLTVHRADSAAARAEVRDGHWDVAVLADRTLLARDSTSGAVSLVRAAEQLGATLSRLRAAGLSTTEATRALQAPAVRVETTSSHRAERNALALVAIVVLFSQLLTFCTWVAMGVVEEKASRVVELVLASVRPLQLLAGKLLGIGVLAAVQVLLVGVVGLVAATASGSLTLPASGVITLLASFVGFVLGFGFFAALSAGVASTVSRQEEVSGVLAPITITITVCYFASFTAASAPDSAVARVLSIVPPVSALTMPARLANGGVAPLDVVAAVVLLLLATLAVIAVAARIYRASILHSGSRVSLRRAWTGEAASTVS